MKNEINILVNDACIKALVVLNYIALHSKDAELKEQCKNTISTLQKREINPALDLLCSATKNSN